MRTLPMLLRLAEEMQRVATTSMPRTFFYEDPWLMPRTSWRLLDRLQHNNDLNTEMPKIGKNGYQVSMDVTEYKPNELTVKVVDNSVVVEGKCEEREDDHGFISRQFVRRFLLPQGFEADKAISTLSSDGVLTVSVPNPIELEEKNAKQIPIQQTGPAHLNIKENPTAEDAKDAKDDDKKKD